MKTRTSWLKRLRTEVEAGLGTGGTLVVAVSGGGDSVALLRGLALLRESLGLRLVVGHLDHGLRADSADDAAFVGRLAGELGLFCVREWCDVAGQVEATRGNLEEVARRVRYGMLERVACAVGADAIVVAHTADDQAETILMHLLRGAGLDGLKGMSTLGPSSLPDAKTPLFRPLLRVERATLRAWLREKGYTWREDATNADTSRFRSRLRHEIIPYLAQEQPRLRSLLARTAQVLAADHAWLEAQTEAAWQELAEVRSDERHNIHSVLLNRTSFLAQPLALQRRLLRRAFFHLRPTTRDLSYEQITHALSIAAHGESGARATLPSHLFLIVEYDSLWIAQKTAPAPTPSPSPNTRGGEHSSLPSPNTRGGEHSSLPSPNTRGGEHSSLPSPSIGGGAGGVGAGKHARGGGLAIHDPQALILTNRITLPQQGTIIAEGLTISLSEVGTEAIPTDWRTFPSHIALLDATTLDHPLHLRPPQAADRWAPLGMGGKQVHLRDWMAKHKVPLAQRDHIPLLVDAKERILWVVGWQVGHIARVRRKSKRLVRVVVEKTPRSS